MLAAEVSTAAKTTSRLADCCGVSGPSPLQGMLAGDAPVLVLGVSEGASTAASSFPWRFATADASWVAPSARGNLPCESLLALRCDLANDAGADAKMGLAADLASAMCCGVMPLGASRKVFLTITCIIESPPADGSITMLSPPLSPLEGESVHRNMIEFSCRLWEPAKARIRP